MTTEQRYGADVWNGLLETSFLVDANIYGYVTVGQVAGHAGVSRNTAKKYLDKLSGTGNVSKLVIGRQSFYRRVVTNGEIA